MRERVSAWLNETGATMSRWWRAGYGAASRSLARTRVWLKPRVIAILERLEAVLLNAKARERIHAGATFAFIFAFAFVSVDFLVAGGGFDFGAPARAAEPPSAVRASMNAAVERNRGALRRAPVTQTAHARPVPAAEPMPAVLSPALAQISHASVVEVSHRLDAPLEPEATSRRPVTRAPLAPLVTEAADLQGAEAALDAARRAKPSTEALKPN